MGYYVEILESTFVIPSQNLTEAYDRMCKLNYEVPNAEKHGGCWPGKDKGPKVGPFESAWFSWMPWNYHETCENVDDILRELGFETHYDDEGNLHIDYYNSKAGQEELFLESICSLAHGYIIWKGEDGAVWGETYGGKMVGVRERGAPDYSDLVVKHVGIASLPSGT